MKILINRNIVKWILYLVLFICFTNTAAAQIGIVVNNNNPINDISITELKQIYLAKQTMFSEGNNIVLAEYTDIKEQFYDILLGWSVLKYNKYWMKLIFSGESDATPKEFNISEELIIFVSKNINAIAFISIKDADEKVKILTVDGKNSRSKDYPFK